MVSVLIWIHKNMVYTILFMQVMLVMLRTFRKSVWSSSRLPPHSESSLVACASTCSRRNKETLGSCTALVYSPETKDCHLGTATLAELGQQGEVVYVMKGAGGEGSQQSEHSWCLDDYKVQKEEALEFHFFF